MAELYELLHVESSASAADIARAYRKQAILYHPDRNPSGADHFKQICSAYEILSDPVKRGLYDATGVVPSEESAVTTDPAARSAQRFSEVADELRVFFKSYIGSDEEREDLTSAFKSTKGDFSEIMQAFAIFDNSVAKEVFRIRDVLRQLVDSGRLKANKVWKQSSTDEQCVTIDAGLALEREKASKKLKKESSKLGATRATEGSLIAAFDARKKMQQWDSFTDSLLAKYSSGGGKSGASRKAPRDDATDDDSPPTKGRRKN